MTSLRCVLAVVALLPVAAACDGPAGGYDSTGAALEIQPPDSTTLPTVTAGGQWVEQVILRSVGIGELVITVLELERLDDGPAEVLSLGGDLPLPIFLGPGESRTVDLVYRPQLGAPDPSAVLHVDSSDRIAGPQTIWVEGPQTGADQLDVDPSNLSWRGVDLFDAKPRCESDAAAPLLREFVLTNVGRDALEIADFTLDPPGQERNFTICPSRFEGDSVGVGKSRTWNALFHPQEAGAQTVVLDVVTARSASARVTLRGTTDAE